MGSLAEEWSGVGVGMGGGGVQLKKITLKTKERRTAYI